MAEECLSHPLYSDSFPKEALDNVLRFLSPCSEKWETHIEVRDLLQLFAVSRGLGSFVKSRFKTFCVCKSMNCHEEHENLG